MTLAILMVLTFLVWLERRGNTLARLADELAVANRLLDWERARRHDKEAQLQEEKI